MTSGGHTRTEAWNLQLQARVRDLETDLAEAETRLRRLTDDMKSSVAWALARDFLGHMQKKRALQVMQAAHIDSFLAETETKDG